MYANLAKKRLLLNPMPVSLSGSGAFESDDVMIAFTQKRKWLIPKQNHFTGTFIFAALVELQD